MRQVSEVTIERGDVIHLSREEGNAIVDRVNSDGSFDVLTGYARGIAIVRIPVSDSRRAQFVRRGDPQW